MLKKIIALLFLTSIAHATMTVAQAQQALTAAQQADSSAQQIVGLAQAVLPMIEAGNQVNVIFSTNTCALTTQQQADILTTYTAYKTQLQQAVNSLP